MSIKKEFLGWDRSCLDGAVEYLLSTQEAGSTTIDLRKFLVVLPSARAGRRLVELLVQRSEQENISFLPPETITVGGLPERCYVPDTAVASTLERLLAWQLALSRLDEQQRNALLTAETELNDFNSMFRVARRIEELAVELNGAQKTFADVQDFVREMASDIEAQRWEVLQQIDSEFAEILKSTGRLDKHAQRRKAVEHRELIALDRHVLLVSAVDLNPVVCQLLEQLPSVTALIHAPEEYGEGFDSFGRIITSWWSEQVADIPQKSIAVVQKPVDQARVLVDFLIEAREEIVQSGGSFPADDVVVGVADQSIEPVVSGFLTSEGITIRKASGDQFDQTAPGALLGALHSFLSSRSVPDFATLIRHPDIQSFISASDGSLTKRGENLSALDEFQRDHLQAQLPLSRNLKGRYTGRVRKLYAALNPILELLPQGKSSLNHWTVRSRKLFSLLYGEQNIDRATEEGRHLVESLAIAAKVLDALSEADEMCSEEISANEFLQLFLFFCSRRAIPPRYEEQAVEVLGWLELHLEDAPVLVITGCNEGSMPESLNSDPFLPDSLRTKLGLQNNDARYARDLYFSKAIYSSRPFCRFVAGRTGIDRSPLLPGRILLSCKPNELSDRVTHFFHQEAEPRDENEKGTVTDGTILTPPRPEILEESPSSIAVTAIRSYLECPYRFYLRHVLRLRERAIDHLEMDPARFGTLLHEILNSFGDDDAASSSDEDLVFNYLSNALDERVAYEFSSHCLPAVRVQIEQLRYRLKFFARWQAERAASGWRILETEYDIPEGEIVLPTQSGGIALKGRIDRIDHHLESGEIHVLDYKTGDVAYDPKSVHGEAGDWRDLQLPAYLYVMSQLKPDKQIEAGYISIARDEDQVGLSIACWSREELQDAWSCMTQVAENVSQQRFWPPTDEGIRFDDFQYICRSGQFGLFEEVGE